MKYRNALYAIAGVLVGTFGMAQIPAIAQDSSMEAAWEVIVTPFGQQSYAVVKHNTITGQTLILDCAKSCSEKDEWWELPVAVIK